jgi:alkanesulfonate monooxygenase SsuD/methylene tetrahydromethanopterin reductase-like flavin-dependent oxidoreductase (luciferase family)
MELRIFIEPQQGASYATQLRMAQAAEELGYGAFFRSDHYLKMGPVSGLPGPTDSWLTLAGLARETSTIRLGTIFRFGAAGFGPSGFRGGERAPALQLLRASWYEAEHQAYAIPFPGLAERFARLEEQLAIITGMWGTAEGETFSFDGVHYTVRDSPGLPKPVQHPRPPVIVGGGGPRRTPRLAALYADEFNRAFAPVKDTQAQFERVHAACETAGRDPSTLVLSVAQTVCCGRDGGGTGPPGRGDRAFAGGPAPRRAGRNPGRARRPARRVVSDRHPADVPAGAGHLRPRPHRADRQRGGPAALTGAAGPAPGGQAGRARSGKLARPLIVLFR